MDFLDSRPEGLYRIKGYVDFGVEDRDNRYAVHAVGRFLRFYPEPWACSAAPHPARADRLRHRHLGSGQGVGGVRKGRPHADEHSMCGVLRYVQDSHVQDSYPEDSHVQDEEPDGLEETG